MAIITGSGDLDGTNKDDTIVGSSASDTIDAGNGNDLVFAGRGNDFLVGGNGTDTLYGGSGNDVIGTLNADATLRNSGAGDNGGDTIYGDGYNAAKLVNGVWQFGEVDASGLNFQNGILTSDLGNDTIFGGNGKDTIWGDSGNNATGAGAGGADVIYAGNGNDTVYGEGGNDKIFGENGVDNLNGGSGNDTITGGNGGDQMWGGSGDDRFAYLAQSESTNTEYDTINDFAGVKVGGNDKIDLGVFFGDDGNAATHTDDLVWNDTSGPVAKGVWYDVTGGNTFVHVDTNGDGVGDMTIKLVGVHDLDAADFIGVFGGDTDADVGDDLAVTLSDHVINNAEKTSVGFTVAGLDGDAQADVTFTDSSSNTVVVHVTANGSGTANLTGLADGTINVSILATDTSSNTATGAGDTADLDTNADVGGDASVSIALAVINDGADGAVSYTVAGVDADATADVTFSSSGGGSVTVTGLSNGTTTVDLSSLNDGTVTASIAVTDDAGNTATGAGDTADLDTTADVGGNLTLTITDTTINNSEETNVGFSVSGMDADLVTATVTFSDGVNPDVVVNVIAGNGSYSANLS
ncbi:MAG TPA: calcium-binding protein, partial [Burkholderiales bacterium]|nr:calcium-binding protein [Burkholderiales bacterium]